MDLVMLNEQSDPCDVFDALRPFDLYYVSGVPKGDYPDGLMLERWNEGDFRSGINWTESTKVTAYAVSWLQYSYYRGREITRGYTVIDCVKGGLAPDGYCVIRRYLAPLVGEEEIRALMLLASRGTFPFKSVEKEL